MPQVHSMSLDEYKDSYPGAPVHSSKNASKQAQAARQNAKTRDTSGIKTVICPVCQQSHEVSKYFCPGTHDLRCPTCKGAAQEDERQAVRDAGVEGVDYVECRICGFVGSNLKDHLRLIHQISIEEYQSTYPDSEVYPQSLRDKFSDTYTGRKHSVATREKMRDSAGWNRGLSAESDERVARMQVQV